MWFRWSPNVKSRSFLFFFAKINFRIAPYWKKDSTHTNEKWKLWTIQGLKLDHISNTTHNHWNISITMTFSEECTENLFSFKLYFLVYFSHCRRRSLLWIEKDLEKLLTFRWSFWVSFILDPQKRIIKQCS